MVIESASYVNFETFKTLKKYVISGLTLDVLKESGYNEIRLQITHNLDNYAQFLIMYTTDGWASDVTLSNLNVLVSKLHKFLIKN